MQPCAKLFSVLGRKFKLSAQESDLAVIKPKSNYSYFLRLGHLYIYFTYVPAVDAPQNWTYKTHIHIWACYICFYNQSKVKWSSKYFIAIIWLIWLRSKSLYKSYTGNHLYGTEYEILGWFWAGWQYWKKKFGIHYEQLLK